MKKLLFSLLTLLSAFFFSCSTDVDILGEYKDTTVVYGLLNQDSATYIKVNKAFLGDGNALIMAKVQDSSLYKNDISVVLYELNDTDTLNKYVLDTITIGTKEPGVFYNPYQLLYYTDAQLDEDYTYFLKIVIGDKEVTASTELIDDFDIQRPPAAGEFFNFLPVSQNPLYAKWYTSKNGKRYDVAYRFYFKEKSLTHPDTIMRYVDWNLGTLVETHSTGGKQLQLGYMSKSFYTICENNIPYDDPEQESGVYQRWPYRVEFVISVASTELNTYMDVNSPSNSIVQERPQYTNINNGIGLFASRYKKARVKYLSADSYAELKKLNIKF